MYVIATVVTGWIPETLCMLEDTVYAAVYRRRKPR